MPGARGGRDAAGTLGRSDRPGHRASCSAAPDRGCQDWGGPWEPGQGSNIYRTSITEPRMSDATSNPKAHPDPHSNAEKPVEDWVTGDEPMTGAQASYLKTLSEEAGEAEAFDDKLTKAEASKRIDALKQKTGRGTQGHDDR